MSLAVDRITELKERRVKLVERAWQLRMEGRSLFFIADSLGVSKEWLRTYANLR